MHIIIIIITIVMFICQRNNTTEAMYRQQWTEEVGQRSTYDCPSKQTRSNKQDKRRIT